ncbi:Cytochrome P450 [Lasiodiplodia theobromae]|uniref:Linoleate 10R-lipoxygenase n=1 Tax=Lasiodiplodia theobromae TaxID=45133 RepID=A0A5N5DLR4_9PEZI|nr:Cytochrome P450 [Lasiodiplodia theobromae]KAB2578530.1 Linoleate 10R-lipoxygenase [Lasiodiplodia theobromae]KAF4538504.1 Cytochrome P450 [Lasiodiplodia theobromae]
MLRRLSTTFRKDRKKDGASPNGTSPKDSLNGSPTHGHSEQKADSSKSREEVKGTFEQFAQVLHASRRPLPTQTGDGSYVKRDTPASLFENLKTIGIADAKTLKDVLQNKAKKELLDDKTYLMERVIQLVADLPGNSALRVDLTNAFVDELWDCLQHPPVSYLGDQFTYRQADGSYNNIMYPHLGAANTPYARSVQPKTVLPGALPDPGLVFDAVFAREEFKEHPNKVSSILFYWASLIIHDLFQTDHRDMNMSKTSSYLDLAPLYGDTQEDQNWIRTFKDGKLKADCFSESRLLGFPPGCGVLLIMFNRFHNFVVDELAKINEGGRFTKPNQSLPPDMAKEAWAKYDNDLFQTGRLITCGLYINITLLDYLRTIVNLNRSNTTWTLDPRVDMAKVFGTDGTPRGIGNQVSAEFNLVYRWHSATSKRDEQWTEEMYKNMFGKSAAEVPMDELLRGLAKWDKTLDKDPQKRAFGGMQRDANGKYADDDLVKILTESIEDCAGSFGANNVPKALRAVEILGMQQARKWGLATLNEFRKFFGLKPHDTFESINSDPKVAEQLRHLYDHPDYVELYPGLVSEEAKEPMVPGVGIAPTYTVSKAILSDAVVLVRGDRFYTVDYHPRNLTNWGYNEVQYDLNVEQGCVFYKLFLRAFPAHFKPNSIYAHYPMTIPSENRKIMRNLGRESHYSWDRPAFIKPRVNITSYVGAKAVLEQQKDFKVTWGATLEELMGKGGAHFMLSGDEPLHAKQRKTMAKSLYRENWQRDVKKFYEHITLKLLHEKSFKIAGINHVDLTRDVGNLAHVHFASNMFSLPLKTKENPRGIFTEHEMYMALAVIFCCIFFDLEPAKSFPLHRAAYAVSQGLGKLIEANVKSASSTSWISSITDSFHENNNYLKEYGVHMVRRLLDSGLSAQEVAWSQVFPTATAMVPNQSQVFTQIMDFYLSPRGTPHLAEIRRLARLDTSDADDKLMHYAMEAIRLNGTFGSYRAATSSTTIVDGRGDDAKHISVSPGDKVFVSFVGAAKDPEVFPNPEEVLIDRPLDRYIHYGEGPHTCLGRDASRVALTAMLKTVGKLDGLRRAPGPKGELKKIPREGGFYVYMREDYGSYFPFPLTMQVCWDGDLPPLK